MYLQCNQTLSLSNDSIEPNLLWSKKGRRIGIFFPFFFFLTRNPLSYKSHPLLYNAEIQLEHSLFVILQSSLLAEYRKNLSLFVIWVLLKVIWKNEERE